MPDFTPPAGFTGYRVDLEDNHRSVTRETAVLHEALLMRGEWQTSPNIFDWWHVRNQGNMGSCRGHSGAANARLTYYLQNGLPDLDGDGIVNEILQDDFSPMWVYLIAQMEDGLINRDNGSTIGGGVKAMKRRGNAREVAFPYPNPVRYSSVIPRGAEDDARQYMFRRHSVFDGSSSVQKLFDWIGSGQGGVDWGTVWPLPFVKGCLVKDCSPRLSGGGHATAPVALALGSDVVRWVPNLRSELKDDEHLLVVANSHGEHAEYNGFYFVTEEGAAAILDHSFTEAIGLSDMETPKPRKVDWLKESALG